MRNRRRIQVTANFDDVVSLIFQVSQLIVSEVTFTVYLSQNDSNGTNQRICHE